MTGAAERRRHRRRDVRIHAQIECLPELDEGDHTAPSTQDRFLQQGAGKLNRTFGVVIRNLSSQGAFVASDRSPALRSRVRLVFPHADGEPLSVTGVVVWRRNVPGGYQADGDAARFEPGFGIVFETPSPAALAFIRSTVRNTDS